jgi:hypothetical protein
MKSAVMVGSGVGVKLSNPSSHPQSAERELFLIPISSANKHHPFSPPPSPSPIKGGGYKGGVRIFSNSLSIVSKKNINIEFVSK